MLMCSIVAGLSMMLGPQAGAIAESRIVNSVEMPGFTMAVEVEGDHAFVGYRGGVAIFDVRNGEEPQPLGRVALDSMVHQIEILDGLAFVASGDGMYVMNISDLESPEVIGHVDEIGETKGLAIDGDRVFVSCTSGDVISFDISDPSDPKQLSKRVLEKWNPFIVVQDNLAYVCNRKEGLVVLNVSKDKFIRRVSATATGHEPFCIALDGEHALIADKEAGLTIWDVRLPRRPQEVSTLELGSFAYGIELVDSLAYISGNKDGVYVVDVSDMEHPSLIERVDTPENAYQVAVHGRYGYVADGKGGLRVIEFARD